MFLLQALGCDDVTEQGRVSMLQWNKHPTLLIQNRSKKNYLILYSSQIDFIQYKFEH